MKNLCNNRVKLLTVANPKFTKSEKYGYRVAGLLLKPWKLHGHNNCPFASPGCIASCLNTAGRGGIKNPTTQRNHIQRARYERTRLFIYEREKFLSWLRADIERHARNSAAAGFKPAFRLNTLSDLRWESIFPQAFEIALEGVWYDYTKDFSRMKLFLTNKLPSNYHLVFSRSEKNEDDCHKVLEMCGNIAVVFDGGKPKKFWGYDVVDADEHDLIFLHRSPRILGLKAKGRAKKDKTGFVVKC